MNEQQYLESCRLQNQLRKMQYDQKLTPKQRKKANEFYKAILNHPHFPSVYPDVVRKRIEQVLEKEA